MTKLSEVFGVKSSIPTYTYVDRAGLDSKFAYLLTCDRHLVIHGASKQGKTVLRRKGLPEARSVIVQGRTGMKLEQVYLEILRQLGSTITKELSKTWSMKAEGKAKASGEAGVPLVAKGKVEGEGSAEVSRESETTTEPVGVNPESLSFVASEIRESGKRVIIEDFHYLPEEEQRRLAFDLKAFWDLSVYFIIVGIWAEQNLLAYYNGDLTGRTEEIDIEWTNNELEELLKKGEKELGFLLDIAIRQEMLADASHNVGLLQRIAEKYCFEAGIYETMNEIQVVTNREALAACRKSLCKEESVRYRQFFEAVVRGFKGYEASELKVYQHILRVCLESSDQDLCSKIHRDNLLTLIQKSESRVRLSDLSAALNKLDRLQADRKISPLVISYNHTARKVQLVDRELLFFRKYSEEPWPWQDDDDGDEARRPQDNN